MKHIQGEQFLKQTSGQKLVASHFLSSKMPQCPMLSPSCMFTRKLVEASAANPPSPALGSVPHPRLSPTQHPSVRQHQAHGAVTDTVFELQVCAESTGELLLLLTQSRHRGLQGWVEGSRGSCQLFLVVFTAHMAQTCTLCCHPLLSPQLPQPAPCCHIPGLTLTPGRLSLLSPPPKISFALGKTDASEAVCTHQLRPSTRKDIQRRLSHANSLSL